MDDLSLVAQHTKGSIYTQYPLCQSKSEIRILEILSPSYIQDGDEIRVRFHTVSLKDNPLFCALSYVWGNPSDTEPVTIELEPGKTTTALITKNLATALRSVKWHYERRFSNIEGMQVIVGKWFPNIGGMQAIFGKWFKIWVDALCINQNDITERNEQVRMMKDIYSKAEIVFGSLCAKDRFTTEHITRAFEGTEMLYQAVSEIGTDDLTSLDWMTKYDEFQNTDPDNLKDSTIFAVMDFPFHEYFRRVWIAQEICLAKALIFFHQKHILTLEALGAVHFVFARYREMLSTGEGEQKFVLDNSEVNPVIIKLLTTKGVDIPTLFRINHRLSHSDEGLNVSERWLVSLLATDMTASLQKDYIYGFLGLAKHDITIDYSENLSLASLYGQLISCLVQDWPKLSSDFSDVWELEGVLIILAYAGLHIHSVFGGKEEELPSWAPAFHLVNRADMQVWPPSIELSKMPQKLPDAADAVFSLKDLQLSISGISIDNIAYVAPKSMDTVLEENLLREFCDEIIKAAQLLGSCCRQLMKTVFQAVTNPHVHKVSKKYFLCTLVWLASLDLADGVTVQDGVFKITGRGWSNLEPSTSDNFVEWYDSQFKGGIADKDKWEALILDLESVAAKAENGRSLFDLLITTDMIEVFERALIRAKYRRVFITASGLIGHGPDCAEVYDSVAIFKGSKLAHVVRPASTSKGEEQKWLYVSRCFMPCFSDDDVKGFGSVQSFTLV